MTDDMSGRVIGFVGVYHADGGPLGEAKYLIGKLLGSTHCSLCDITHSPMRRKPEWDRMVARLGAPVALLHLNELGPDVDAETQAVGSPVVLARLADDSLATVLSPTDLDRLDGSVDSFERALHTALARAGLKLA